MQIKNRLFILFTVSGLWLTSCMSAHHYAHNHNEGSLLDNDSSTRSQGIRYLLGHGVSANDSKAFYYFKIAAENDDPFAQNELAFLYASGRGTSQDYTQALKWYQKAADAGLPSAQYNLGVLYAHGLGTTPNPVLANRLIKQAAAHGFQPAMQSRAAL